MPVFNIWLREIGIKNCKLFFFGLFGLFCAISCFPGLLLFDNWLSSIDLSYRKMYFDVMVCKSNLAARQTGKSKFWTNPSNCVALA